MKRLLHVFLNLKKGLFNSLSFQYYSSDIRIKILQSIVPFDISLFFHRNSLTSFQNLRHIEWFLNRWFLIAGKNEAANS